MPSMGVKKAQTTYPTGNKDFAVLQCFPAGFTAKDADPFLMCDEFGPSLSKGPVDDPDEFPINWHPHRGQDLLTFMKEGTGRHGDSLGNRETFNAPGIQWISAGSGIEHAEGGAGAVGEVQHGFQIWVNVPADRKMDDPRYGTHSSEDIPIFKENGLIIRVLAGELGDCSGPFKTVQPVQIFDVTLDANTNWVHEVPKLLDNCLIYVYKGSATICGDEVSAGSVIRLNATTESRKVAFVTKAGVTAILFAGKMLNEPIAWQGPFVMNTDAQIQKTFSEYRGGTFLRKRANWNYKDISTKPK